LFFFRPFDEEARKQKIAAIVAALPLENERVTAFYKDTDEVRADLEMGGLGPGLTGEHTSYSFVVCRSDNEEDDEKHMKRWVIKKRYSHCHIFDKILMQIIKEEGGDDSWLPEVCVSFALAWSLALFRSFAVAACQSYQSPARFKISSPV